MKSIEFHINYHTRWGESLHIHYAIDDAPPTEVALTTEDGTHWHVEITADDTSHVICHSYRVKNELGVATRLENNHWRRFYFNERNKIYFNDVWCDEVPSTLFHRSVFCNDFMLGCTHNESASPQLNARHLLIITTPPIPDEKVWAVAGNTPSLGQWHEKDAVKMQRTSVTEWVVALDEEDVASGFEYKFILLSSDGNSPVWETGENRHFAPASCLGDNDKIAGIIRFDSMPRGIIPLWKAAGVVMPVFSLKSHSSWGVGDMNDLLTFVHWAADCGMKSVQLLPINDTTTDGSWHDSYPYNCVSVFALHPIYLSPEDWRDTHAFKQCEKEGHHINTADDMDYEAAYALKMRFAHALFREIGPSIIQSEDFNRYCKEESAWLDDYATFCTLRNFHHTANFRSWPSQTTDAFGMGKDLIFHKFLQFLLHCQMLKVHQTAQKLGVMIKGDIPIGISPDSVPAWKNGNLFHFDGQAGAPPDDFATRGQNWGFPTYNWNAMSKDHYRWWRQRLMHMGRYFDAYRIDHVLGFFRIWEVPKKHIYGVMGHFRPALPYSKSELREFGFRLPINQALRPTINAQRMNELCHEIGEDIRVNFFETNHDGSYSLKPEFESQRYLQSLPISPELKEALCDTACEVLFVSDPDHPDLVHPRVSAQRTHRFKDLSESDKEAFCRLHDHFFYVRHNEFWKQEAMHKLPCITNYKSSEQNEEALYLPELSPQNDTGMLPCAEDLGMVPSCVKDVLQTLGILSLEIQRMPKTWGRRFGLLRDNPYFSVSTIATHDMPPLRLWWKENTEQTEAFWKGALHHTPDTPSEALPEVCEEVVKAHFDSPSMLCLLSFQDITSISPSLRSKHPETEQINVPSNPNQYWRYRMHLYLEDLLQASGFNEKLRALIHQSGR